MFYNLYLSIADTEIKIESPFYISTERQDRSYKDFFKKIDNSRNKIFIEIFDSLPNNSLPGSSIKIFDSHESWSLYKGNDHYYILYKPKMFKKPFWLAESNKGFDRIKIFCGNRFFKGSKKDRSIFNPVNYPLDQIIMVHYLSRKNGILIHSSGIKRDGNGYLFPGVSGAGKSTISELIYKSKMDYELLSDDRIIIKRSKNGYFIYGTPWSGEGGFAINSSARLKGIFFIEKGDKNEIIRIEGINGFNRLVSVVSIPWYSEEFFSNILNFCDMLIRRVPLFIFRFRLDEDAIYVFEKYIKTNKL